MDRVTITLGGKDCGTYTILASVRVRDSKGRVWPVRLALSEEDVKGKRKYRNRSGVMCHPMDLYVFGTGTRSMFGGSRWNLYDDEEFIVGVNRRMERLGYAGGWLDRAELGMQDEAYVVLEAAGEGLYDLYQHLRNGSIEKFFQRIGK
jgi:hypothetical protein